MPVTPRQKQLLKARSDMPLDAQRAARGFNPSLGAVPPSAQRGCDTFNVNPTVGPVPPWQTWPGQYHADSGVGPDEWTQRSVQLSNAGAIKFGNHVCLPQVCYKKRTRHGFCRMLYWHWHEYKDDNDEVVAQRLHGLPLQQRRSQPHEIPVRACLPHRGLPALERTHPFHFKMTPAAMLGSCCNHDLSVLFRFGDTAAAKSTDALPAQRVLLKDMIETITDHEYYTGGYMAKGGDKTQGLLHSLHDATLQHSRFIAQHDDMEQDKDPAIGVRNARKLFYRLIFALNKRHKMGFASIYAYLFNKPSTYSSHLFTYLNLTAVFAACEATISAMNFFKLPAHLEAESPTATTDAPPASRSPTYTAYDYQWRPRCLEAFPLYFFSAGTDVVCQETASCLPWPLLKDESGATRRHPCYERRACDDRYIVHSAMVRNADGGFVALLDPDTQEILRTYDHYRQLRCDRAWRVPELGGYMPHKPSEDGPDATPEVRGRYALFVMLLFRPWRNTRVAVGQWSGIQTNQGINADDIWLSLHGEYTRWRQTLQQRATDVLQGPGPPRYNTQAWWDALVYEKLRNFELTTIPKSYNTRRRPTDAAGNPLRTTHDSDSATSSDDENGTPGTTEHGPSASTIPTSAPQSPAAGQSRTDSATFKRCGDLGAGFYNHFVYSQEGLSLRSRGVEATYVHGFTEAVHSQGLDVSNLGLGATGTPPPLETHCSLQALRDILQRQHQFFSELDDCHEPETTLPSATGQSLLGPCLAAYPAGTAYTPTCAIDAAVWLIQTTALDVKCLHETNVKQARSHLYPYCVNPIGVSSFICVLLVYSICVSMCLCVPVCYAPKARALLLASTWLQHYLTKTRVDAGLLPPETWKPSLPTNHGNTMLVLGGAGAGKTHLLLVVEKLYCHYLGPDCVRKAAPTITAARLLGGNTLHALRKLPRTNLSEKRARMSAATLAKHRKAWIGVVGHAADECGMLSPKLLHQVNDRTQSAKQCTETFGGLWTWLSGDFLQLPPVGQPSLAQPVPDIDSLHQCVDGSDEHVPADLDPENRALACVYIAFLDQIRSTNDNCSFPPSAQRGSCIQ